MDAAEEVKPYQRQVSRDMDAKVLEQLKGHDDRHRNLGGRTGAHGQKLKPVTEKYTEVAGPELVGELNAQLAKLRGSN